MDTGKYPLVGEGRSPVGWGGERARKKAAFVIRAETGDSGRLMAPVDRNRRVDARKRGQVTVRWPSHGLLLFRQRLEREVEPRGKGSRLHGDRRTLIGGRSVSSDIYNLYNREANGTTNLSRHVRVSIVKVRVGATDVDSRAANIDRQKTTG